MQGLKKVKTKYCARVEQNKEIFCAGVEQSRKIFCAMVEQNKKLFCTMVEETHCGKPRALQLSFTEPPSGTACDDCCE